MNRTFNEFNKGLTPEEKKRITKLPEDFEDNVDDPKAHPSTNTEKVEDSEEKLKNIHDLGYENPREDFEGK